MNKLTCVGVITLTLALLTAACAGDPTRYVERGNTLSASGKYAEAEINYRKAIQKNPRLGEAYYRLGTLQLRDGRPEDAYTNLTTARGLLPGRHDVEVSLADASFAAYLRNARSAAYYNQVVSSAARFLKEDPKSFDGLRLKAYVAMFDRHYPEAIDLLRTADAVKPLQQDVIYALVECLIQAHQGAEAEKLGQSLIQRDKTFAPIYETLYRYYASEKRLPEAEAVLKAKVANNPANAEYLLELASHYAGTGNETALKQTIQQLEDGNKFPDSALQIGDFYTALNRMDDAVSEFQAGAAKYPKQKLIYEKRIARVLIFQGKKDQAANLIDQILRESANDYDARMMRASINVDSGDPGKLNSGAAQLQELVREKPADATVRLNLGKARILAGDPRGAVPQFEEAIRIDPQLTQARLLAADASLHIPDYQQALKFAEQVLQGTSDSPVARLIKVKSLAGMGNTAQATMEANQLTKDFPNEAAAKLELASLKLGQKNSAAAESIYRALYIADRSNLDALRGWAQSLFAQNQPDAAIGILKEELLRSNSAESREMLADAYLLGRKLEPAIEEYRTLVSGSPNSSLFHLRLGDAYMQAGRMTEAVDQFREARKLAPKDATASSMLALALEKAGRDQEALQAYRDALALDSENPLLMNNLAFLIAETGGDLNDALGLARRASQQRPADSALSDTLGWIYLKKNMADDAFRVLAEIVRKNPAQPIYRYHLASALVQKGDKAQARKQLELALADGPTTDDRAKIAKLLAATH